MNFCLFEIYISKLLIENSPSEALFLNCNVYKITFCFSDFFTEILLILFHVTLPRSTSTLQNNYIGFHNIFTPSIKGYFR